MQRKLLWVFTPSRTSIADLTSIFVQRHALLQDAVDRVRNSALTLNKHHLLFVGPRGCGKTHLVTLLVDQVGTASDLSDVLRIAWLNEDETCTSLLDLLFKIYEALLRRYPGEFSGTSLNPIYDMKQSAAEDFLGQHIVQCLGHRTLLLVNENLDALFEGLGDPGQKRLRAFLQENTKIAIVATAQRLADSLTSRNSPFFGFFQTEHLKPLNVAEAAELLQNIARLQGISELIPFLLSNRGRSRVRALHHLSGGNHRIYIVLSQFLTSANLDDLVLPFLRMIDELTPYYQERVRWLPPLQRKIVEYLCICETTVSVKAIAKRVFSTPQTISSQLQDLRQKGYVEANQRGREMLYEISEPMMRICIEVKENQRDAPLRLLVDFLRVWYDDHEIRHRITGTSELPTSRRYLQTALERNTQDGNLRQRLLIADYEGGLLIPVGGEDLQYLENLPDGVLEALTASTSLPIADAIKRIQEAIEEEDEHGTLAMRVANWCWTLGQQYRDKGKLLEAVNEYTKVLSLTKSPSIRMASALLSRGFTYGRIGDIQQAIGDYTSVIGLNGAAPEQVADALFNLGVTHGQMGDTQRAIDDYTSVIGLDGAALEQVAKALVNRGVIYEQMGDTRRAIDDYTSVIGLDGAAPIYVADALINRGATHGQMGDTQRAIDDYTAVISLDGAAPEQVAAVLFNRGVIHGQMGDIQRAIDDYTTIIGLDGLSPEQVARALVNRGVTHGQMGDTQRAIEDYTAVIGLDGAAPEQVAAVLINRGVTHGKMGDTQREIDDYTAVIGLEGAAPDQVAMALVNRGVTYGRMGDPQRAIDDYTAVIVLEGLPPEQVANALFNRGIAYFNLHQPQSARQDFLAILQHPGVPPQTVTKAQLAVVELSWSEGRWMDGFAELGVALQTATDPSTFADAAVLIQVLFSAGLSPENRSLYVHKLGFAYSQHQRLSELGDGLLRQVGTVFQKGTPYPSADNLDQWAEAWEQFAAQEPGFAVGIRLFRTAIQVLKTRDQSLLLDLVSTEREIVQQALGLTSEA